MTRPRNSRGPWKLCSGLLRRLLWSATTGIPVSAAAPTTATTLAGTFVEFLAPSTTSAPASAALVLALRTSTAHFGLLPAGHHAHAAALLRIRRAGAVARSERDFEFVEFVPLGIGPIAVGDGQQLLHALAW